MYNFHFYISIIFFYTRCNLFKQISCFKLFRDFYCYNHLKDVESTVTKKHRHSTKVALLAAEGALKVFSSANIL
jgi:hypothetical protein